MELDLRTTKDSVLVVMHDETVNRMTNGQGKVSDLSYADLQKLSVSDKQSPGQKKALKSFPVPTFEDVLKTCKNKIHIYLDFKNASVSQTLALIEKYKMLDQVIVYINSVHQYTGWRHLAPGMPLMISLPESITTKQGLDTFLKATSPDLLDGDYSDYTAEVIQAAKAAAIPAWPDIQSETEDKNWDKAISMGFTGLQTNHPEALISYLRQKGLR